MSDFIALLLTFLYVSAVLLLSYYAYMHGFLGKEGSRKVVHILVSFSVLIIAYAIRSPLYRIIGPAVFIVLNAFIGKTTGERTCGLVLYPLSLLLLTLLFDSGLIGPESLTAGMLVMGLGDGAAAVAGLSFGRIRIGRKTVEGSLAMYAVSFVVFMLTGKSWNSALLASSLVTVAEAFSPHGLDNLTVPLLGAILAEAL